MMERATEASGVPHAPLAHLMRAAGCHPVKGRANRSVNGTDQDFFGKFPRWVPLKPPYVLAGQRSYACVVSNERSSPMVVMHAQIVTKWLNSGLKCHNVSRSGRAAQASGRLSPNRKASEHKITGK